MAARVPGDGERRIHYTLPVMSVRLAFLRLCSVVAALLIAGCGGSPWNNPYPAGESGANILYTSFSERPKHLDPVQAYSENEYVFINQIYEPPLQYHYLKRPFTLIPFAAREVPQPRAYDSSGQALPSDAAAKDVGYSVYEIRIKPGILYQPHPAFAKDASGTPRYFDLTRKQLQGIHRLSDFEHTGSRELNAADYAYQIKRLAHPRLHSPILGLMSEHIVGLKDYAARLKQAASGLPKDAWLDLNQFPLEGVEVVDSHTYRIRVHGRYTQFIYWLAMPFFAPIPWEADRFYSQPGLAEKNITFDWYPVGTGPYMLVENNPNQIMVLARNPNFKGETYPAEGGPGDAEAGLLRDAGKPLPFVERVVFTLEKEGIPYWNKFLQGYYDASGISNDNFDQTIQMSSTGDVALSDTMQRQGIRLDTSVATSIFYMGFNMLDPVVGATAGERGRKLRLAISIAIDQEEFIAIFANGRGLPGMGPLPPGIFGYLGGKEGINPYVYDWKGGRPERKPVEEARRLLAEAGYPNGRDEKTGQPLLINLDTTLAGVGAKSRLDWLQKQFERINVQLVVRSTDYNRFQDKIRKGNAQLFYLGWNADYPDPENFLFLLNGPQGKVQHDGENAANYSNPEYDTLFEQMKNLPDGPERQVLINRMVAILQHDAPWVWGFNPKDYSLAHEWVFNRKPNQVANNTLKYQRVDPALRERKRREWNQPVVWPIVAMVGGLGAILVPGVVAYRRRERMAAK
ncbi:MAG TPA: ABC transporter substrate-binding protein [Burkholderiales bacterium]|nr:ABC transporter substrate-binding protein [Burkholderiales bacterium]